MIGFYNQEVKRFDANYPKDDRKGREAAGADFIDTNPAKISWTRALKSDFVKGKQFTFDESCMTSSIYRPFTRQWLYYNRTFNEMVLSMPRIYPIGQSQLENFVIQTGGSGPDDFTALMTRVLPCLDNVKGQCYPRYLYDEAAQTGDSPQGGLALEDRVAGGLKRRDAITDEGLSHFRATYPGEEITKDDLFYYVYGLLHSEEYRTRFADNLSKQLPRIPVLKQAKDFWAFVEAGRRLGDLHCDYESVSPFPVTIAQGALELAHIPDPERFYRVEKMKFGGKRPQQDKSTVIYNGNITMTGIPLEAYDYVVNGKPALEWVMERQCVKTDKASGIVNDANRYAIETVGDPAYPLRLFKQVITVSLETMKIVRVLPKLEID
jgi:predicted helicase